MGVSKKPKKVANPEDFLPLGENDRHVSVIFHGQLASGGMHDMDATLQQFLTSHLIVEANILGEGSESFLLSDAVNNNGSAHQAGGSAKTSGGSSSRGGGSGRGGSLKKDMSLNTKVHTNESGNFSFLLSQKRITISLPLLRRLCGGFAETQVSFYQQSGVSDDGAALANSPGSDAGATSFPPSGSARDKESGGGGRKEPATIPTSPPAVSPRSQKTLSGKERFKQGLPVSPSGCCLEKVALRFEDVLRVCSKRYDLHLEKHDSFRRFLSSCWLELTCTDLPLLPDALLRQYYPVRIVLRSLECCQDFLSENEVDTKKKEPFSSLSRYTGSTSSEGSLVSSASPAAAAHREASSGKSFPSHGAEGIAESPPLNAEKEVVKLLGDTVQGRVPKRGDSAHRGEGGGGGGLYAVIDCLGQTITTPPLSAVCRRTVFHSSSPTSLFPPPTKLGKEKRETVASTEADGRLKVSSASDFGTRAEKNVQNASDYEWNSNTSEQKEMFHSLIFLGHSTPLRVYQRVLSEDVTVSVYRQDPQHRHLMHPSEEEKEPFLSKVFHLGTATFSLRSLVEYQQTFFNETLQLLPNRTSLVKSDSTLTSDSTVSVTVEFFQPLPTVEHVDANGVPVKGSVMTRGALLLPYAGEYVEGAMTAFLRELLRCKRGDLACDVRDYEPPKTEEVKEEDSMTKKGKRATKERSAAIRDSKKDSDRKGKKKVKPPTPPPPPEVAAFDAPFKVISPEGISGFEVMDDEMRFICLEGPAPDVHHILQTTAEACGFPEDGSVKILFNAELFTPSRLYGQFPPLITRINREENSSSTERGSFPSPVEDIFREKSSGLRRPSVGVVVHPDADLTLQLSQNAEAAVEAEAGGTAGRLHRIRLREPLRALAKERKFLLHRLLSEACLTCIQKLFALTQVDTLWRAVQRHYFPSALDLIHLERSFGQTLNLQDVFARASYVNRSNILMTEETNSSRFTRGAVKQISRMHEVNVSRLCEEDVGLLTSFSGRLLAKAKCVPAEVLRRYSTSLWMVTNTGVSVLCAFPREVPGGTIQYVLEGQVVKVGRNTFLLYIMEFHTISNNITNSKNPEYEDFLRQRRQCEKRLALLKAEMTRTCQQSGPTAHSAPQLRELQPAAGCGAYRETDSSSLWSKSSLFACRNPSSVGHPPRLQCAEEGSDDDSEEDARGDFPPDDAVSSVSSGEAAFVDFWEHRCGPPHITKSAALLRSRNQKSKPTAERYMRLWERYDRRAGKILPEIPTGPVMHFGNASAYVK